MPSHSEFYDAIKNISVNADTLNLNTDQVESKLDTTTGLLTTLSADTAIIKNDLANGVLSDVRDGTGNALTSATRGSQRALSVQIVDGSGNQVTSFGSSSVSVSNFPATQPVSLASVPSHPVTGTFWQATQPVSIASAPVTPVTDNGGSLTVDGSITATQSTASSLKAQAQLLNAAGTVVEYATTGSAGTPATDVVSVQGVAGGTVIPVSVSNFPAIQIVSDKGATGQGTVTSFTSTSSSVLRSSNSNRKLLTVFNEGSGTLFILLGSGTASTTNYSLRILSGDYYELEKYTGEVTAIFTTAGTAKVTEIT